MAAVPLWALPSSAFAWGWATHLLLGEQLLPRWARGDTSHPLKVPIAPRTLSEYGKLDRCTSLSSLSAALADELDERGHRASLPRQTERRWRPSEVPDRLARDVSARCRVGSSLRRVRQTGRPRPFKARSARFRHLPPHRPKHRFAPRSAKKGELAEVSLETGRSERGCSRSVPGRPPTTVTARRHAWVAKVLKARSAQSKLRRVR
jgi:hypothetical protein